MTDADVSQIRAGDFTVGINGMEIKEDNHGY